MKKFVCLVCGYVYEGESAPDECPICHAPASKFAEQAAEKTWAAEHVVGIAKGVDQRIIDGLHENFNGECLSFGYTQAGQEMRADAENGATMGKFELAKLAKELNLDAIHDTVHEMAKDEARHGRAFEGLLKRYFNK